MIENHVYHWVDISMESLVRKFYFILFYFSLLWDLLVPFQISTGFPRIRPDRILNIARKASALGFSDPEVYSLIQSEYARQSNGIELIASENFASAAVLEALGSCLTNKYSEGLPGKRYYGGNQIIDQIEVLCKQRALRLFNLSSDEWAVNVQPYSGSPANMAAYLALLEPCDRIMGLDLPSGGHLSHGYATTKRKVSAASIFYESKPYKLSPATERVDYDHMEMLALEFKPKLIIAGASAYTRDWDYAQMRNIADKVGAYLMADIAHISGLVAVGAANNPFTYCDVVTSTTHKSLRGPRSGMIFSRTQLSEKVDQAVFPALQGGPHNNQIVALAVALKEALDPSFTTYIYQVISNAKTVAKGLMQHNQRIVTNGTDNHQILWDLRPTGITGSCMEKLLERVDVYVNKNSLFGDVSAFHPGGIRLGTLAVTTKGMKEKEMVGIVELLISTLQLAQKIQQIAIQGMGQIHSTVKPSDFMSILDENQSLQAEATQIRDKARLLAAGFQMPSSAFRSFEGK